MDRGRRYDSGPRQSANHEVTIRVVCDVGTVAGHSDANLRTEAFVEDFRRHEKSLSTENKVNITGRLYDQISLPLKSVFVKWKHSNELGVNVYSISVDAGKLSSTLADLSRKAAGQAIRNSTERNDLI